MDEEADIQNNDFMTSVNDGIEVIVPSHIQAMVKKMQEKKATIKESILRERKKLRELELERGEAGKEDLRKKLNDLERREADILASTAEAFKTDPSPHGLLLNELLPKESDYDDMLEMFRLSLVFSKNQEFNYTIITELHKCTAVKGFRYYVLFLEFHSYNLTEMNEYKVNFYNKANKANGHHIPDSVSEAIVIEIKGADQETNKVIEEIDKLLTLQLKDFKNTDTEGQLDEEHKQWVVLYFATKFFLSELALEQVIKFINEVHYTPSLCFAFIFKKIEDAIIIPNSCDTYVKFIPYEKDSCMFYQLLWNILSDQDKKLLTRLPSPAVVRELLAEYEQFRMSINSTAQKLIAIYRVHQSEQPTQRMSEQELYEYRLRKFGFLQGLTLLRQLLEIENSKDDMVYKDLVMLYCDFDCQYFPVSAEKSAINFTKQRVTLEYVLSRSYFNSSCAMKQFAVCEMLRDACEHLSSSQFVHQDLKQNMLSMLESINTQMEQMTRPKPETRTRRGQGKKPVEANPSLARDHADRKNLIIYSGQTELDLPMHNDEIAVIESNSNKIRLLFRDFFRETVEKFIDHLARKHKFLLIDDYDYLMSKIEPDFLGVYMDYLEPLPKKIANPSEGAIRLLYDIIAQSNDKFKVPEIYSIFIARFGSSFPKISPELTKHLFYYSLTTVKRIGLIHENNRMAQILQKNFYKKTGYRNQQHQTTTLN